MTLNRIAFISIRRTLLILLIASIPSLVSIILIASQANFLSFSPTWSDEIFYWHQILTFKVAAFQGGYYTINEAGAAATFTHFYTYGPWFVMIYGTFARFVGWERITFILFNMGFVTGALVLFCKTIRIQGRQFMLLGVTLGTFWCLVAFLPTAMQEAFQQALAILIATVFYVVFKHREKISWKWYVSGATILILAAVLRISWAILLFPFLWLTTRPRLIWRLGSLGSGVVALVVIYTLTQYTGSPGNNSIAAIVDKFLVSFGDGWVSLVDYFTHNLNRFVDTSKQPLDLLQTVQILVFMGSMLLVVVAQLVRKQPSHEALFHIYNLGAPILVSCAFYIIATWGDYRVIGTHLMVSLLLLIAFKRYLPVYLFTITNLLFIAVFYGYFQAEILPKYQVDVTATHALHSQFEAVAPYQPDPKNAWCNTVIFQVETFDTLLTAVPAGMGLSFFKDANVPGYRSQYVLVNQYIYDIIQRKSNPPQLEPILTTSIGTLYRNHNSNCPSSVN